MSDPARLPSYTRSLAWSFLVALAVTGWSGCGRSGGDSRQVGRAVQDEPVTVEAAGEFDPIANPAAVKGGSFFTWGGGYPKSLNMWLDYNTFSIRIIELMFESLAAFHATRDEPRGVLAESWEVSDDKLTYTFKIRDDATWSDGRPITAHDVVFFYDVIMNPKHLTALFRVDLGRFARPEALDDKTVRLVAQEAHWSNFWVAASCFALPKHVWEGKDFNTINFEFPVVSGPYHLHQVNTNRSISLQRRGDWWGRHLKINQYKYNFDYIIFRSMDDREKALEMLKRGDFDLYPIYTARIWVEQTDFPQVQKNWVVRQTVYNQEPKAFQGFAFNLRREKFQDVRVREAFALLLNRELMLDRLMFNQYFLLNNYYPDLYENNQNPDAPLLKFDPTRARALLEEAGWKVDTDGVLKKDGRPFELVFLNHGDVTPQQNIYIEDLKAVGIQARIETVSMAAFMKRKDDHDFDMLWANWGAARLNDPEAMWHSRTADDIATNNVAGVKSSEIDALIEAQRLEMDLGKRNEILRQIDRHLVQIQPYVLLWQSDRSRLLYWNRFGTPEDVLDKFNREESALVYWWFDPAKAARLEEAMRANEALPAEPAEVHYSE